VCARRLLIKELLIGVFSNRKPAIMEKGYQKHSQRKYLYKMCTAKLEPLWRFNGSSQNQSF
jgi:hypothetical protein